MKKNLFLFCLCFLFIEFSEGQITFQKVYGGQPYEVGYSVQQTADSGYIIAGRTTGFGTNAFDAYLIKTDVYGDILWTKTYGEAYTDYAYSVRQTTDGGYIVAGTTLSFGAGNLDVYLIKTNSIGDTMWTKTYGGTNKDEAYSVEQTTDGGYIIAGYTKSFGVGYEDVYLIKTNANGDLLWSKTYGGVEYDEGHFVQQTTDGGYIVTGYTISFGAGEWDVYLIKTDSLGNKLWTKAYGKPNQDEGWSVEQTSDGGYIIAGYTNYSYLGSYDAYLIKTDSLGNLLWSKAYGGNYYDKALCVHQISDGGYILTGTSESNNANAYDAYLIKTDSIGDILWSRTYGSIDDQGGFSVQKTMDGGYIISGYDQGSDKIYLIKTNANGKTRCNEAYDTTITSTPATQEANIGTFVTSPLTVTNAPPTIVGNGGIMSEICISFGINETTTDNLFFISPNPFTDEISITLQKQNIKQTTISIKNILGQTVFATPLAFGVGSGGSFDLSFLEKGIYLVEINTDAERMVRKIVKE